MAAASDAWIACDECEKWRRLPAALAEALGDSEWRCELNPDAARASCAAPQELSDAEIDAQMAAAADAAEEAERAAGGGPSGGAAAAAAAAAAAPRPAGRARRRPAVWQLTAANMYLHRERRRQDEDDVMICQCKTIWATDTTSVGCGEACLNRMLNIECVAEHCPSGARCSNQAFTRREAAPLAVRRAGAKGFGLFTAGPLRAGQFIIEYVGEVLEEDEYARRREFYAGTGQRHYYFMNVGNGEVIDATRKGGEGRFINHSCAPNCETQKWVVRGELAIGLFALEDVPAGAELTFDYNFERYGDKPMKCLCGAPGCRGMIGGTQETAASAAAAVVTPDSDEEEPEPIMVTAKESDAAVAAILDREVGLGWERGWEPKLSKRLEKLAAAKGVDLGGGGGGGGGHSEDDEEAAAAATAAVEAVASGRKAGRAPRRPAAPKPRRRDEDWKDAGAAAEATRAQRGAEEASAALASPRGGGGAAAAAAEPSAALIPKRAPSLGGAAGPRGAARRRSEVDRRLESMVGPSGRLRDAAPASVMRLLRLFNLCDIGPTVARAEGAAGRAASGSRGSAGSREDGEASPLREGGGSAAAAAAPPPPRRRPDSRGGRELTARQRARLADLSLLLEVVLVTSALSARREFVRCGLLRQLHKVVGRNVGEGYTVVLRKALRVVEALPLSADDVHGVRSAQHNFADLLRDLSQSADYEVRARAWAVLKKWPVGACARPAAAAAPDGWQQRAAAAAASSAGARPGGWRDAPPAGGRDGPSPTARYAAPPPPLARLPSREAGRWGAPPPPGGDRFAPHDRPAANDGGASPPAGASRKRSRWDSEEGFGGGGGAPYDGRGAPPPLPPPPGPPPGPLPRVPPPLPLARPPSATLSASSGAPPPPPPADGPVLSPITDDDDAPPPPPEAGGSPGAPDSASPYDEAYGGGGGGGGGVGGGWDEPDASFEAFVAEAVRRRVGKYEQPDHPARLARDDAAALFSLVRRDVVAGEAAAWRERERAGVRKRIERAKLEPRIAAYVRDRVRRWSAQRAP